MSVSMKPGATALTVTLRPFSCSFSDLASACAASRAIVVVSPNMPDFAAA